MCPAALPVMLPYRYRMMLRCCNVPFCHYLTKIPTADRAQKPTSMKRPPNAQRRLAVQRHTHPRPPPVACILLFWSQPQTQIFAFAHPQKQVISLHKRLASMADFCRR